MWQQESEQVFVDIIDNVFPGTVMYSLWELLMSQHETNIFLKDREI